VLLAAVLMVFAIACANVANLIAVRAEGRRHEMAVRQAIGARRGQLVRVQLSEALVIAGASAVLATGLARLLLPFAIRMAPEGVPRLTDASIDLPTMAVIAAAALVAALACGLAPALRSASPSMHLIREGARGSTGRRWGREALVAAQTALALVLLIGSALLLRSHTTMSHIDPGYRTEDRFTFQIAPEQKSLTDGETFAQFIMNFTDRLRALPDVETVGVVENIPLDEGTALRRIRTETMAADGGTRVNYTFAGEDYFKAMAIRVLEGRPFSRADATTTLGNAVVSRSAANALWPGQSAIGRRLQLDGMKTWETVVAVVEDVKQNDFRTPAQAVVYLPLRGQDPKQWRLSSPAYVIKTRRAETIAPEVRAIVRDVAPEAPMYRVYTMAFLAQRQMQSLSFTMLTLGMVSVLALILGTVGLYGALSYVVAERTREIGVRMALGAKPARVRWMVVIEGAQVVLAGLAIGLVAARFAAPALDTLVFGIDAIDWTTFLAVAGTLFAIGLLASYIPARRASSVDPLVSLRGE
jgi:putative ABC transport system permease protein